VVSNIILKEKIFTFRRVTTHEKLQHAAQRSKNYFSEAVANGFESLQHQHHQ